MRYFIFLCFCLSNIGFTHAIENTGHKLEKTRPIMNDDSFNVHYEFKKTIHNSPPELLIRLIQFSKTPQEMYFLEDPVCFAQTYLKIIFEKSPETAPKLKSCNFEKSNKTKLTLNKDYRIKFPFNDLFASNYEWKKGNYQIAIDWTGPNPPSSSSFANSTWSIATPLVVFRVNKNETVQLPDGAAFKFTSHSHKTPMSNSESPLMIFGDFKEPNKKVFTSYYESIYLSQSRTLNFPNNYFAELKTQSYNEWMELIYYGKIPN